MGLARRTRRRGPRATNSIQLSRSIIMNRLFACGACQRYIRENERLCPFCGESAATGAERSPPPALPRGRSRRAAFAMRTALLVGAAPAIVACGGSSESGIDEQQGGASGGGGVADVGGSGGAASPGALARRAAQPMRTAETVARHRTAAPFSWRMLVQTTRPPRTAASFQFQSTAASFRIR